MNSLPPGWRRKPLPDCPMCGGKGTVIWRIFNQLKPVEYACVGRMVPTEEKKGKLILAETAKSKTLRKTWVEYASQYENSCACVTWIRTRDFDKRLKRLARYMKRVEENKPIQENSLNDSLKDI